MENIATTSAKYNSNLAATVKGLLESTSSQSLTHTWIQDHGDSGLSMVSGGKKKLRKYDFAERLDSSCPTRVGARKSEMLWGKGLQQICKRMAALIDEARADFPTATMIPMIYWNGNELVGKDGIEPTGIYPYDTPTRDAIQLLEDTKRHLLWTMNFAARKGCACLGVLTGASSVQYGFSMMWDRYMSEVRNFIINEPSQMLVYVDATSFVETIDLLDRYHMCFSDDNIIKAVQFMRGTHHMLYMLSILHPAMGSVADRSPRRRWKPDSPSISSR